MGTILVSSVLDRAGRKLIDTGFDHWTKPELLDALNDGQRVLVSVKPDANTAHANHTLAAGTLQTIPDDGLVFQRVLRNLGTGDAPGRAVTWTSLEFFDSLRPDWHTDKAKATVRHYLYDPGDPEHFYVWPPQPDPPGKVELVYAAAPADCVSPDSDPQATVQLDDIYVPALVDFMLSSALEKQGKQYPQHLQASRQHYGKFLQALGVKEQGESLQEPRSRRRAAGEG